RACAHTLICGRETTHAHGLPAPYKIVLVTVLILLLLYHCENTFSNSIIDYVVFKMYLILVVTLSSSQLLIVMMLLCAAACTLHLHLCSVMQPPATPLSYSLILTFIHLIHHSRIIQTNTKLQTTDSKVAGSILSTAEVDLT
ncbi:hypothetical protein INR49_022567, partial [Caranx melampygus]